MKKNTTTVLIATNALLAIALTASLYIHWDKPAKIAYVHSGKLVNEYRGMASAKKAFKTKATGWQANIDTLANELKDATTKFESEKKGMTAKERDLTAQLLGQKQRQLADYENAIRQQAAEEDQQMTQKVIAEINDYLTDYGKRQGYQVILAATEMGNIAYATEAIDITDIVLEGLNEGYTP